MDTKWLEDFVSLAETRTFSRSARLRHITQPAFSRRIRSLEEWAGAMLFDRSSGPARLTQAGQALHQHAVKILDALQEARSLLRDHTAEAKDLIEFAVPHTLAFAFFPQWLSSLRDTVGPLKSRLSAFNVYEAVSRLIDGHCDLLIVYYHEDLPLKLGPERYEVLRLGTERIVPYTKPGPQGKPLYSLDGRQAGPHPYLAYAPSAYLSRVVDLKLQNSPLSLRLDRVYETDMAEGLKAMALEGHGIAFLPESIVREEVARASLIPAMQDFELVLDIRLYRVRPANVYETHCAAATLWDRLETRLQ